jgi:myo-inositol-1(or 4)-monophosphatase
MVREAGGIVSDFQGRTDGLTGTEVICANEYLHQPFLKLVKGATAE